MEVIIVLIAVGILGYVFYQSLPNPKFRRASALFDAGKFFSAEQILLHIFDKHPEAPAKLAECKLKQGKLLNSKDETEAVRLYNEAIGIGKRLPRKAVKDKYVLVEALAYFAIAENNFNNYLAVSDAEQKAKNLESNIQFIDKASKNGVEKEFASLKTKHLFELADIHLFFGINSEKSANLSGAIKYYETSKKYAVQSSSLKTLYTATARIGISKLKSKEHIEQTTVSDINKAAPELKRDFYFRHAKKHIAENEFQEAENMISNHLNFSSGTVDQLREVLKSSKINDAVRKVIEINDTLDQLYENSFSVDDVKNLYDSLDKTIDDVSSVMPEITDKLREIKPSLFNRLLTHYITEEQYGNAMALIQKYPAFWEKPELLKDLGICCYGYLSQGNLNEKNYRTIISDWLTAVYCDKVILKSMEDTAWDDEYTFTLSESIGSNFQQHEYLPDNVNYDEPSDTNISIGETQKELLKQFEKQMHAQISDHDLLQTASDFYDSEKEAIENIVRIIDCDVLFTSPYFAKTYGIHNEIVDALDNDYRCYFNEDALKAGVPYVTNLMSGEVGKYSLASALIIKLLSSIENENLSLTKTIVSDQHSSVIEEFETIRESVEDSIFNAFSIKINEDDENEDLIPIMSECMQFTSRNEKLKFQYSNYVADLCIAKVNSDEMSNFKALSLMKSAYMYSRDNSRICMNIITLIRYNLSDYLNDECRHVTELFGILETIRKNRSIAFNENNIEIRNELKKLDDSLKKQGLSVSVFVSQLPSELSEYGKKLQRIAKTYLEFIR